jgi:hypothetical protein
MSDNAMAATKAATRSFIASDFPLTNARFGYLVPGDQADLAQAFAALGLAARLQTARCAGDGLLIARGDTAPPCFVSHPSERKIRLLSRLLYVSQSQSAQHHAAGLVRKRSRSNANHHCWEIASPRPCVMPPNLNFCRASVKLLLKNLCSLELRVSPKWEADEVHRYGSSSCEHDRNGFEFGRNCKSKRTSCPFTIRLECLRTKAWETQDLP